MQGYSKNLWYWEFLDLIHKMILTGALQFVAPEAAERGVAMILGISTASLYLVAILLTQPYIITQDNQFLCLSQSLIWSLMYLGLVSLHSDVPLSWLQELVLNGVLLVGLMSMFFFFIQKIVLFTRRTVRAQQRRYNEKSVDSQSSDSQSRPSLDSMENVSSSVGGSRFETQ